MIFPGGKIKIVFQKLIIKTTIDTLRGSRENITFEPYIKRVLDILLKISFPIQFKVHLTL